MGDKGNFLRTFITATMEMVIALVIIEVELLATQIQVTTKVSVVIFTSLTSYLKDVRKYSFTFGKQFQIYILFMCFITQKVSFKVMCLVIKEMLMVIVVNYVQSYINLLSYKYLT